MRGAGEERRGRLMRVSSSDEPGRRLVGSIHTDEGDDVKKMIGPAAADSCRRRRMASDEDNEGRKGKTMQQRRDIGR